MPRNRTYNNSLLMFWIYLFARAVFASGFTTGTANVRNCRSKISDRFDHHEENCEYTFLKNNGEDEDQLYDANRRTLLFSTPKTFAAVLMATSLGARPDASWAGNPKSRTDGYTIQKSDSEWQSQLSDMQYYILRRGGTESPNYSILESEKRPGIFVCAGCGTNLFDAKDKFNSGTGWPSFARGLEGVEVEQVNPISANLLGAELRCKTCGGHLGDVFNDGYLFVGTPAFATGKRFCIDGAALAFQPATGEPEVKGDIAKSKDELPSWFDPPTIVPQS